MLPAIDHPTSIAGQALFAAVLTRSPMNGALPRLYKLNVNMIGIQLREWLLRSIKVTEIGVEKRKGCKLYRWIASLTAEDSAELR